MAHEHHGDDAGDGQFPGGSDFGLGSPDNLVWSDDGYAFIQEDLFDDHEFRFRRNQRPRSQHLAGCSGNIQLSRVAEMDRLARLPDGAYDADPDDLGNRC